MLTLLLWLKYLRKRKIILLSIGAVGLSCALLIIVCSLFIGFIDSVEKSAVAVLGDIDISPPVKITEFDLLVKNLEQLPHVQAATGVLTANGLLHLATGNVRAVTIWGVEPAGRARVTDFKSSLLLQKDKTTSPAFGIPGKPEEITGFLGIAVIADPDEQTDKYDMPKIKKTIGQRVILTTGVAQQGSSGERTGFKHKVFPFTITDIVFTGVYHLDKSHLYLPIEKMQQKLYPNQATPVANKIQIKLAPDANIDDALKAIDQTWQNFAAGTLNWSQSFIDLAKISTAKEMQSRYVAELRKQLAVLLLIFGVISLGVVLLISAIFYMIVQTRQKDIAIIKSCGATSPTVVFIFVGYGACVGIAGSALGLLIGSIITKNINTIEQWITVIFGLKLWKSSVYMFDKIPSQVDISAAIWISIAAIIAASLGALIPAVVAARTNPVEILRYE